MRHKIRAYAGHMRQVLPVVVGLLLVGSFSYLGVRYYDSSKAATGGSIYISPSTASPAPGSTVSVTVNEDSGDTPVDTVYFQLHYDASQLQYVSLSEGSTFDLQLSTSTAQAGLIKVTRGMGLDKAAPTGAHAVVTLNFKVLASSGTASLTLDPPPTSYQLNAGSLVTQAVSNASYTITSVTPGQPKDASLSFSPSSGSYKKGDTVTVDVKESSPTQEVYGVTAYISYPANQLQYVSTKDSPVFPTVQRTTDSAGTLQLIRAITLGAANGVKGSQTVATVTFKVIGGSGNVPLSFASGSKVYTALDDGTAVDILGNSGTASFVVADTTPGPNPGGNPGGDPNPSPNPGPSATSPGASEASHNANSHSPVFNGTISYQSKSGGGSVSMNGSNTQLQGSVELAPVIDPTVTGEAPTDTVVKVEYYLNNKLIDTEKAAPFTYQFDSKKLRNGTYTITIKTYYASGATNSGTNTLVVKNPVTVSYIMAHYTSSIFGTVMVLVVAAVFIWKYMWPRFGNQMAMAGNYNPYADAVVTGGTGTDPRRYEAPVVAPTTGTAPTPVITPEQEQAAQTTPSLQTPSAPVTGTPAQPQQGSAENPTPGHTIPPQGPPQNPAA